MERVRCGMIGCGGNGRGHLRRLMDMPEVDVVGLSDVSEGSLRQVSEAVPKAEGIPRFRDYRKMLDSVEMDAAVISTPHTLHFEQITDSLDRGLHVLTEKPMVCTVEHARQVIERSREAGKILMVSYQRHFSPEYRFVRNQILNGEIGEIQFVSALQDQNWYRSQKGQWRLDPSLSGGGQLNDSGSHLLDIVLWMTDEEPAEVAALVEYFDTEVDINSSLSVRFAGGGLANFSVVGSSVGPGMWEDITIWGIKGVIYIRNGKLTCKYGGRAPVDVDDLPSRFAGPDHNFVDAILGRDEIQVPPICGLRVIQLTEAAWQSAGKRGRPVKVKSIKFRQGRGVR